MALKDDWEDERDPLAALRAGDARPFEAFVEAELPTFLGFFARLGASPGEAEDHAQDLFLNLYQHSQTYQRRGRFLAYAFRVARNLWIDGARRSSHRERGSGQEGDDDVAPLERYPDPSLEEPSAGLQRAEEASRLRLAVAGLSEPHRMVFELGVVQELPYQEIGAILDIPVGTVKSRMYHAVRKLQEALGGYPR